LNTTPTIINITNNQNSFNSYYEQYNMGIDEVITDRVTTEQLEIPYEALPPPPIGEDCNYDALWSGVVSVINFLDQITVDILEQLTAANDQNERYASMVEAIPFVAELPLDEALEYTSYISQELENSYNAVVTLEFKQAISCELFCKLKEDCASLSNSNLIAYLFGDKLGYDLATITQLTAFSAILGLPFNNLWIGTDMALSMWATAVWLASAKANYYGGFGDKNINIAYRTGLNSPDSDWEILCENCGEIEPCLGTTNAQFATPVNVSSLPPPSPMYTGTSVNVVLVSSAWWYLIPPDANGYIGYVFPDSQCFYRVSFVYRGANIIPVNGFIDIYIDGTLNYSWAIPNVGGVQNYAFDLPAVTRGNDIRFQFRATSSDSIIIRNWVIHTKV